MKVSIITAVRNGAEFISATLKSVASQRYADLEHVVIDGASTDGTVDVVKRLGSRVSVLISERDAGVYDAFNKGLARASGGLIGFLGAGDRFVDDRVIELLAAAAERSGADAVFGDVAIVDPGSQRVKRHYRSSSFSPLRIAGGYMPAHPSLLVRRAVYDRFGGYDTSYRVAGDFEFVARTLGAGGISYAYVPETFVLMADGGLSNRGWKSKWLITKEMRRACKHNDIPSGWIRLLARLPVKYLAEVLPRADLRVLRAKHLDQ